MGKISRVFFSPYIIGNFYLTPNLHFGFLWGVFLGTMDAGIHCEQHQMQTPNQNQNKKQTTTVPFLEILSN